MGRDAGDRWLIGPFFLEFLLPFLEFLQIGELRFRLQPADQVFDGNAAVPLVFLRNLEKLALSLIKSGQDVPRLLQRRPFNPLRRRHHLPQNRFFPNELDILFDKCGGSRILSKRCEVTDPPDPVEFILPLELFANQMDIGRLVGPVGPLERRVNHLVLGVVKIEIVEAVRGDIERVDVRQHAAENHHLRFFGVGGNARFLFRFCHTQDNTRK